MVFYLSSTAPEDAGMKQWAVLLFASSVLMVLVQVMVAVAVVRGTFAKACMNSDQCESGSYCEVGHKRRCMFCGATVPIDVRDPEDFDPEEFDFNVTSVRELCGAPVDTVQIDPLGNDTPFLSTAVVEWCNRCVHAETYTVDTWTGPKATLANINAMTSFDWMALYFAGIIVALTSVAEIKDILLCNMAIDRASANLSSVYTYSFRVINGVRRWSFLPTLLMAVNFLILGNGTWELNGQHLHLHTRAADFCRSCAQPMH